MPRCGFPAGCRPVRSRNLLSPRLAYGPAQAVEHSPAARARQVGQVSLEVMDVRLFFVDRMLEVADLAVLLPIDALDGLEDVAHPGVGGGRRPGGGRDRRRERN